MLVHPTDSGTIAKFFSYSKFIRVESSEQRQLLHSNILYGICVS